MPDAWSPTHNAMSSVSPHHVHSISSSSQATNFYVFVQILQRWILRECALLYRGSVFWWSDCLTKPHSFTRLQYEPLLYRSWVWLVNIRANTLTSQLASHDFVQILQRWILEEWALVCRGPPHICVVAEWVLNEAPEAFSVVSLTCFLSIVVAYAFWIAWA